MVLTETHRDDDVRQRADVALAIVGERARQRHGDLVLLERNEVLTHAGSEIGEVAAELIGELVARFFGEENVEQLAARVFGEDRPVAPDEIDSARFALRGEVLAVEGDHLQRGVFLLFEEQHLLEDVVDIDLQVFVLLVDLVLQLSPDLQRSTPQLGSLRSLRVISRRRVDHNRIGVAVDHRIALLLRQQARILQNIASLSFSFSLSFHTTRVTVEAIAVAQKRLFVKPRQPYIELARIFSASCRMSSCFRFSGSFSFFISPFTSRRFVTRYRISCASSDWTNKIRSEGAPIGSLRRSAEAPALSMSGNGETHA